MGMQMTDSCCSRLTCEDHPCALELCIAKASDVATGTEPGLDLGATLLPSLMVEATKQSRPSLPMIYATLRSVPRGDPQALLQIFLI